MKSELPFLQWGVTNLSTRQSRATKNTQTLPYMYYRFIIVIHDHLHRNPNALLIGSSLTGITTFFVCVSEVCMTEGVRHQRLHCTPHTLYFACVCYSSLFKEIQRDVLIDLSKAYSKSSDGTKYTHSLCLEKRLGRLIEW